MSLLAAGLAAGAVSAVANGVGAIAASKASEDAYNAQKAALDKKESRLANWRNRVVDENGLQSATSQSALTKLGDMLRTRNQAVAAQQQVTGGTDAAAIAQKEQNRQIVADTASQIVANADSRRDKAEQMALEGQMNIDDSRANLETQRANQQIGAIQTAASGVGSAAGDFLNAYAMQKGMKSSDKAGLGK